MKKISVCITTYNGEPYLAEQLTSILKQLQPGDEVIISDDSSTDSTLDVIRRFNDTRIRVFEGQKFGNPIFNFEFTFKQATGDLIFMSDQDDIWVDGRVDAMKNALETHDMVVCDHAIVNDRLDILVPSFFKAVPSGPGILLNMKKNTYYGCCMAFRRELLHKALPFPKQIPMHDIWLGFVADVFFKSHFIDYPYTLYRKHGKNASTATDLESPSTLRQKIMNRVNYLRYLPLLLLRFNKKSL